MDTPARVLIGGLGYEKQLADILTLPVAVVGTSYILTKETFTPAPWASMYFAEFLTHNYASLVAESQGIIHLSHSLLSCYLVLDMAHEYHKPAWIFVPTKPWKLFFYQPEDSNGGCLACLFPYSPPPSSLLWEEVNPDLFSILEQHINHPPSSSTLWENHTSHGIPRSPHCPIHNHEQVYLSGKIQTIVAVSCGENSVAITPSFERSIDLSKHLEHIKPFVHLRKTNPFFVEIVYESFTCLLFRQGRFIVKGTKEKNTALHLYRLLVGI